MRLDLEHFVVGTGLPLHKPKLLDHPLVDRIRRFGCGEWVFATQQNIVEDL